MPEPPSPRTLEEILAALNELRRRVERLEQRTQAAGAYPTQAGFLSRRAILRYLAILAFAITLGKVFLVDMKGVDAFYRVLSFLALGALLMAASFLYHRYFRAAADAREQASPPEDTA